MLLLCAILQKLQIQKGFQIAKYTPEQIAQGGTEFAHQAALMCWAADSVVKYPELVWLFAIPNGDVRTAVSGARLRAQGVKPGVADLCLPVARKSFHGLFLEMKVGDGKLSPSQIAFEQFVNEGGYNHATCYSWEQARDVVEGYLNGG